MKHPHTLEAFNRASFDPPTPEIIPAETLQADERPTISIRFSVGLAAFAAVAIGVHLAWLAWRAA